MKKCLDCDKDLVDAKGPKKRCDSCQIQYRKLYWKARESNPKRKEQNKKRIKKFFEKNPDKRSEYSRVIRYGKNRKNYLAKKRKRNKKYNQDVGIKLANISRTRIWIALKRQGLDKNNSTMELIGCSKEELIKHLESQFIEGMTWENWSLNGWHIDHIRPISSFDLSDPAQAKECFHYSNLQPLWAIDNLKKSDLWEPDPKDV
jgi:hypothetical protein